MQDLSTLKTEENAIALVRSASPLSTINNTVLGHESFRSYLAKNGRADLIREMDEKHYCPICNGGLIKAGRQVIMNHIDVTDGTANVLPPLEIRRKIREQKIEWRYRRPTRKRHRRNRVEFQMFNDDDAWTVMLQRHVAMCLDVSIVSWQEAVAVRDNHLIQSLESCRTINIPEPNFEETVEEMITRVQRELLGVVNELSYRIVQGEALPDSEMKRLEQSERIIKLMGHYAKASKVAIGDSEYYKQLDLPSAS